MSAADKAKLDGLLENNALAPARFNDLSHGARGGGNLHAPATGTTSGFMSAADKAKLDGIVEKSLAGWISGRDYKNGTLIVTSIPAVEANGDAFLFEIVGNSYGSIVPFDVKVQGYIYGSAIINSGALSTGTKPTEIWLFSYAGFLCCWLPYMGYWQGYTVFASIVTNGAGSDRPARNMVTSVLDVGRPAGRKYEVAVPITQAALSTGATFTGPVNLTKAQFQAVTEFMTIYSDSQAYMYWRKNSGTTRAYIGYGSGTAGSFQIYNPEGDIQFYAGGTYVFRLHPDLIAGYKSLEIDAPTGYGLRAFTSANTYGIYGRSLHANGGGVLGYTGDGSHYGILGYNNAYSFYGNSQIYAGGRITSGADIVAAGHVYTYSGNSWLHQNGNVYGSCWGGYLSTYLETRVAIVYQGSDYNELYFPIGHTIMCDRAGTNYRNGGVAPRLSGDASLYDGAGSGSYLAGSWRSRGRVDSSTGSHLLQRVA